MNSRLVKFIGTQPLFIIADVAGHFDAFLKLVNQVPENMKILLLGDVCDKGPQTAQIIEYILKHKDRFIWLMGNHEHLMYSCYNNQVRGGKTKIDEAHWIYINGGFKTLFSYGLEVKIPKVDGKEMSYKEFRYHYDYCRKNGYFDEYKSLKNSDEVLFTIDQIKKIPQSHIDHIMQLPLIYTQDDLFCSHGHLQTENNSDLYNLDKMETNDFLLDFGVLWNRNVPKRPRKDKKFIVYGHMNMENVYCHTKQNPKGRYSEDFTILPNSFGVCFDLTAYGNKLVGMYWPDKKIVSEPIAWEDYEK